MHLLLLLQYPSIIEPMLNSIEETVRKAEVTLSQLCVTTAVAEQEQLHSVLRVLMDCNNLACSGLKFPGVSIIIFFVGCM